ncbi:MAG TPA: hypothetical protein VKG44_03400, partial [Candidatus Baltobacteraceae bacterium]|nr:hypothetical protein [Candidatus Baltobacteraceae bacterium]
MEPYKEETAAFYGRFVNAAYSMFDNPTFADPRKPEPLYPEPCDLPGDYEMTAWVHMSDFAVFGEKIPSFYGFIARSKGDPTSNVMALRGTRGLLEWYDTCFQIPVQFRPEPSAGHVHFG